MKKKIYFTEKLKQVQKNNTKIRRSCKINND